MHLFLLMCEGDERPMKDIDISDASNDNGEGPVEHCDEGVVANSQITKYPNSVNWTKT